MIGVGIDSVDVPRFRTVIERTPALLGRVLTADERKYCEKYADPVPSLAARFAVKEATMKAMSVGLGAFGFHDVEVVNQLGGAPILHLTGSARMLAMELGIAQWRVSLTHTCAVATALVIAE